MNWLTQHKKTVWFSASAVVALLLLGGIVYFVHAHDQHKEQEEKQSKQKTGPVRVRIIHPKEGGVERLVKRPGTVQAFQFADLFAKVSGYLENQKVDIGSKVKKDDLLAEIYAPEYWKNVEKAGADVKKARANAMAAAARINKAKADVKVAQFQVEQSESDVDKAQALVVLRKMQYKRFKGLVEAKSIQQELLDEKEEARNAAEASLFAARKAVLTAKANVTAAQASVEQANADLADAEAAISVAKAELDRAEVYSKYTQILSPYTGVVTKRTYHNGDFIRDAKQNGVDPLLAVARTDKMRVIIYVPDQAVPYLHAGDTVKLDIDALPDDDFHGKIARLAYAESYDSRTMRAEVDLENDRNLLRDGMYGHMTIHLGREKGVRVPSICLTGKEEGEERSVYVVRDNKAHEVKVRVGIDDGIEATIREGLETSDEVVAGRPKGLKDDAKVEVIGEGLQKAPVHREGQGQEDKKSSGAKGSKDKKKSGGQGEAESKEEGRREPAKSNISGGRESARPSTSDEKERKEFESSGGKKKSEDKQK